MEMDLIMATMLLNFLDTTHDGGFILFNDSDSQHISKQDINNFGFMKITSDPISNFASNKSNNLIIELSAPSLFEKKFVDKITNFKPGRDMLRIDRNSFRLDKTKISFKSSENFLMILLSTGKVAPSFNILIPS